MSRLLRGLIVGLALGGLLGWLWQRRAVPQLASGEMPPLAANADQTEERIVLPAWQESQPAGTPSAVAGRVVLPNGNANFAGGELPKAEVNKTDNQPSMEADPSTTAEEISATTADAASASEGEATSVEEGYCVRCKVQRRIVNVRHVTTANKRPAIKGECEVCGAGMFKLSKA